TYQDLQISSTSFQETLEVSVTIANTGDVAGREVVQLYVAAPSTAIPKPLRELKGFAKTKLIAPGEQETLYFQVTAKNLASFAADQRAWVAEAGTYHIQIGADCTDIRLEAEFSAEEMVVERVH
ncbi:MAG: fibronectin type III-like domain-contianing protein, partial [Bacteroidota bacterium]